MVHVYNPSSYPKHETKTVKVFEKWLLYLVILSIAGISLYWYITNRGKDFEVNLVSKNGVIEYRGNEKGAWTEIDKLPFVVKSSYEIRTLGDSGASLEISDGSKVALGSYTRMVLSRNQGEIDWVQSDGDSHHQTASDNSRKAYKVSVSDGEFSAEGTAFEVKIRDTDTAVLVLMDQVKATYKDKSTAIAKAGEKIMISPVGKRVIEIEDQELKDAWTLNNLENDQKNKLPINARVLKLAGLEVGSTLSGGENPPGQPSSDVSVDSNQTNENQNIQVSETQNSESGEQKITLEGKNNEKGVLLNWNTIAGQWDSWKVLKGNQDNLTYPNDSYRTLGKETNSYLWEISDSQKYYFRLCAWSNEGRCAAFSNTVSASSNSGSQTTATNDNAGATDTSAGAAASSTAAQTNTAFDQSKSGATTRGKCEGSGGHWLGGDKVCKCPPGEYFNAGAGRCQKK
ncbi:MAG: FecR domain-containing protein [Candidatus Moraniibacteriota bacterium]